MSIPLFNLLFLSLLFYSRSLELCSGRVYYLPNCYTNDLEYIGNDANECSSTQTGLESIGLYTDTTVYLDICGNQKLKYCVTVDSSNSVYLSVANGTRPTLSCNTAPKKYITNLCLCKKRLTSKCVNSQLVKIAGCDPYGVSSSTFPFEVLLFVLIAFLL
ncbi:hypothetical protein EIN_307440 [Entamoeba invadens IP1]|uniref:Uncharacterized protein n=1 Tax=Entamoeba invadens IP1 TaxID=370355 RepID=A0A0A1U269_ENTIV|nr:hypothetical protein EIN_307440 [Entamoeba invadens IP1]ELP86738.1 hypothetical protein EIN_307440 [Entamoeba invadens IP1]|eukprot:XP_004186084.1 hypothetical protein EIN_307440 [Entamoeba invadens IP1]